MKKILLAFVACLALISLASAAVWTSDRPTDDTWVEISDQNSTHGGSVILRVGYDKNNDNYYKSFLRFDINESLSDIESAYLMLYVSTGVSDFGATQGLYKVLEKWSEDDLNWNNQPSVSRISSHGFVREEGWVEYDVTSDVSGFLSGKFENHGWGIEEIYTSAIPFRDSDMRYRSGEYSNQSLRPYLVVEY